FIRKCLPEKWTNDRCGGTGRRVSLTRSPRWAPPARGPEARTSWARPRSPSPATPSPSTPRRPAWGTRPRSWPCCRGRPSASTEAATTEGRQQDVVLDVQHRAGAERQGRLHADGDGDV